MVTDTSVTMLLEDNTQYFWTVVAMDSDGFVVGSNDNTINHLVVGTLSLDDDLIPETFALSNYRTHSILLPRYAMEYQG